jgi:heme/copper-type cytochrome/quinol oxidase subunit 1
MSLTVTLALLVAALALAVFAGWRGSRPWDPRRGVRMVPWRFIMLLSGAAIMILAIHIGTLMGVPRRTY